MTEKLLGERVLKTVVVWTLLQTELVRPTLDKGWVKQVRRGMCAYKGTAPPSTNGTPALDKGTPSTTAHPPVFAFNRDTTIFIVYFAPIARTESYFFNTAKIDFLIRNRTTNIIASRSVRLINLALAERCIYWFRFDCSDVFIAGSTLGCTRWCLL